MNYVFSDIESHKQKYPDPKDPEVSKRFKTLEEYLTVATRVIKRFGPEFMSAESVRSMLNSEDAISEIARQLMMADWRYNPEKGRTEYSYRNQCARWAIQDYVGLFKTKANSHAVSLNTSIGDSMSLLDAVVDKLAKEPVDIIESKEHGNQIKNYILFLIKNSDLTSVQSRCIMLKYIDGIESYVKIGQHFDPPISRQAIKQCLDRAIHKLKITAQGTAK